MPERAIRKPFQAFTSGQYTSRPMLGVASMLALLAVVGCMNRDSKETPTQTSTAQTLESTGSQPTRKRQLREALKRGDWTTAESLVRPAMLEHPNDSEVLKNAAIVAGKSGRSTEAAKLADEAVRATSDLDRPLVSLAIQAHLDVGQLYEATALLQWTLEQHPEASDLRRMLVGFLGEAQLTDQIPAHMPQLIRDRQFDASLLVATTDMSIGLFGESAVETLRKRNPQDYRLLFGRAQHRFNLADFEAASEILRDITKHDPSFLPAIALLARTFAASGQWDDLEACLDEAPESVTDHADYWLAVGDRSQNADDRVGAIALYARATRRRPNDTAAWIRLATALKQWSPDQAGNTKSEKPPTELMPDREAIIKAVELRVAELLELRKHFFAFSGSEPQSQREAVAVAKSLLRLGRHWEAEAWSAIASTLSADPADDVADVRRQIVEQLVSDRQWQTTRGHPELTFDLSPFPEPHLVAGGPKAAVRKSNDPVNSAKPLPIRLAERSASWQLKFLGEIGDRVEGPLVPLAQTTGCGGGAIDFDRDGRIDLFLAAAGGTIGHRDSSQGAMMRNLGGRFANLTQFVGCGDRGFGQGVAVGDYNDDGFPDLYLLNAGENRLLRNNGDGTFQDVTRSVGLGADGQWSTSGAIVDVDGDGYCDLVSISYCDLSSPVDKPCYDATGEEISCHPLWFPASGDQVWRGGAGARFVEVSNQWCADASAGRGLGLLAGRLDGQEMSLYIANDASANHFLRGTENGSVFTLQDVAAASGIAVDARGQPQASMGMSVGDFDRDTDLDLFITGFSQEYNVYYRQEFPGFWIDHSRAADLVAPSLATVGFGTQAVDFDADGWDELIVTNGHISDFGPDDPPYAQPLQLFRRSETGRFQIVDTDPWGDYFSGAHVGRALWLADVNSDFKVDVVVTHATEPVGLLINETNGYNTVALELVATSGSRDAVGAIVTFQIPFTQTSVGSLSESKFETRTLHRIAGNGYLCSNEPVLRIGLGNATEIRDVVVQWPSGKRQTLPNLIANQQYLLIEGDENPFPLPIPSSP